MGTKLDKYANEQSTFAIQCDFTDEDGDAVVPNSVSWSLVDENGNVINNLTDQSETPASSLTVVLSGDDLQLLDKANDYEERHLDVSAVYDSDIGNSLPLKDRAEFRVINLKSIS